MINSEFLNEQAAVFSNLLQFAGGDREAQVRLALRRVTQRDPTAGEVARGLKFLERQEKTHGQSPEAALKNFCLLAMSLNEFLYLE
jgi:hypothetical protein